MEAGRRGNIGVGGRHVSLVLALFALFGTVLVLSSSRTVAGVEAASGKKLQRRGGFSIYRGVEWGLCLPFNRFLPKHD